MRRKKNIITSSPEIYRINSVFKRYKFYIKSISYFGLTVSTVIAMIQVLRYMPKDLASFIVFVLMVCYVAFALLFNRVFSRGNPLVFTKAGIYLKPFLYEYWEDISGYSFKRYNGIYRTTFSKTGTGVSIILHNEGSFQRTTNLRGQSVTVTNGIFFDSAKVEEIEKMFIERGIKRRIVGDEM